MKVEEFIKQLQELNADECDVYIHDWEYNRECPLSSISKGDTRIILLCE